MSRDIPMIGVHYFCPWERGVALIWTLLMSSSPCVVDLRSNVFEVYLEIGILCWTANHHDPGGIERSTSEVW